MTFDTWERALILSKINSCEVLLIKYILHSRKLEIIANIW